MIKKQHFKVKFGLLAGNTIPLEVGAKTIKKFFWYFWYFPLINQT